MGDRSGSFLQERTKELLEIRFATALRLERHENPAIAAGVDRAWIFGEQSCRGHKLDDRGETKPSDLRPPIAHRENLRPAPTTSRPNPFSLPPVGRAGVGIGKKNSQAQ